MQDFSIKLFEVEKHSTMLKVVLAKCESAMTNSRIQKQSEFSDTETEFFLEIITNLLVLFNKLDLSRWPN